MCAHRSSIQWLIQKKYSSCTLCIWSFLQRSIICSCLVFPSHIWMNSALFNHAIQKCRFVQKFSQLAYLTKVCSKTCHDKMKSIINFPSFLFYHFISNVILKKEKKKKLWNSGKADITTLTHTPSYASISTHYKHHQVNALTRQRCVTLLTVFLFLLFFRLFSFWNFPVPQSNVNELQKCRWTFFIPYVYSNYFRTMWVD